MWPEVPSTAGDAESGQSEKSELGMRFLFPTTALSRVFTENMS